MSRVANSVYRERFALTLAHRAVDRPPMDLGATDMTGIDGGAGSLAKILGLPAAADAEAVLQTLDIDIRGVGGVLRMRGPLARGDGSQPEFVNEWGITQRFNGHHHEAVGRPLADATLDDLERYPWPEPASIPAAELDAIGERARQLYENSPYVVCARHPCYGIFELGCWLCGFDDFLYRMAGEPEFVERFFEIIWRYQAAVMQPYYERVGPYIHFTTSGDDFGTQTGPFFSPAMFDELIAPFLARRIKFIRQYTDAAFFNHTCGAVYDLIPSLIRAGVDILNPIQPHAKNMEPERLKRDFGDHLTFYGGVDTQQLLPRGRPEEVAAEVHRLIGILGAQGGYILSAAHHIQEDVPAANAAALFLAGREWATAGKA